VTIGYLGVVFIPCFALFLASNFALLPFAWIISFKNIYNEERINSRRKNKSLPVFKILIKELFWLILGIPYLVVIILINDSIQYIRASFQHVPV
jgi:hypothetical protein